MSIEAQERAEASAPGGVRRFSPGVWLATATVPLVSLITLLAAWEFVLWYFAVEPFLFPTPRAVLAALANDLMSVQYWGHVGVTLTEIITGFLAGSVVGILIGTLLALSRPAERVLYPYVVALQSVPKVAIAPLMIVWFGFGIGSKILIVALTAMFPVLVNTIAGFKSTEADRVALLRGLCATRWQMLRYLLLPSAMPYIFAGLNTAIVFSVIGAIVGEFVGARQGIGVVILKANFGLDLAAVFSSLVVLATIGVLLNAAVRALEQRVCFWSRKGLRTVGE